MLAIHLSNYEGESKLCGGKIWCQMGTTHALILCYSIRGPATRYRDIVRNFDKDIVKNFDIGYKHYQYIFYIVILSQTLKNMVQSL